MSPTAILFSVLLMGNGMFANGGQLDNNRTKCESDRPTARISITQMDGYDRYLNDPTFDLREPMMDA